MQATPQSLQVLLIRLCWQITADAGGPRSPPCISSLAVMLADARAAAVLADSPAAVVLARVHPPR
jgi:hypothetical protein